MTLVWSHPPLNLQRIALDPTKDRAWMDADTALGHHLGQIAVADAILAVRPNAIALDDYRRARDELPNMARSLVDGAGREIARVFLADPVGSYTPHPFI